MGNGPGDESNQTEHQQAPVETNDDPTPLPDVDLNGILQKGFGDNDRDKK
jgi:hypothetical protein